MANYSSYKNVSNDRILDGSIPSSAVQSGSFLTGVSNGFTDIQAGDHKVVVATGLFQRM